MSISGITSAPALPRNESVFTWAAPPLKFGVGALDEIGADVAATGAKSCLVLTDPGVRETGAPDRVHTRLVQSGIQAEIFDAVEVEPTDRGVAAAVEFARGTDWDCFVAVGGGSAIDTAKAVNLLTTHPGEQPCRESAFRGTKHDAKVPLGTLNAPKVPFAAPHTTRKCLSRHPRPPPDAGHRPQHPTNPEELRTPTTKPDLWGPKHSLGAGGAQPDLCSDDHGTGSG